MIFITAVCISLVAALIYALRQNGEKEREWARERHLLLTRIQHPEIVVPDLYAGLEEKPRAETPSEPDDVGLVGTIQGEDENG
jgi:hypothetical protein